MITPEEKKAAQAKIIASIVNAHIALRIDAWGEAVNGTVMIPGVCRVDRDALLRALGVVE